jgi:hypothetical protein
MSLLGQKRPKLPWLPIAKSTTEQRVKFVPKEDLRPVSFDHLVGSGEQHGWHGNA